MRLLHNVLRSGPPPPPHQQKKLEGGGPDRRLDVMRFQKLSFFVSLKSIASARSFLHRFARPHGNDEND